ncbi:MAG: hypothetical protein PHX80_05440 [Candidatus Nanoarchaeia archaeon]|nr:hypothetical protein [Candidatus Nanoarchaeia archaeon]
MTNAIDKYNPYNAKVWSNHPVNKDPNPGNIDNNYSDFPPLLIAAIIGAAATVNAAAIAANTKKKETNAQKDIAKTQAAAQEKLAQIQAETNAAVAEQKSKQYKEIAIIGIFILIIAIAGLILMKREKVL